MKSEAVNLAGATLHPISEENYPKFPCWCYHQGLGFSFYENDPTESDFYPYSPIGRNLIFWLELNDASAPLEPCIEMPVEVALEIADKYSKPGAGIGCLHWEAYRVLANEIRRIHNEE